MHAVAFTIIDWYRISHDTKYIRHVLEKEKEVGK